MLQAKGKDGGKARISASDSWLHEMPQRESECEKCCEIYGEDFPFTSQSFQASDAESDRDVDVEAVVFE